VKRKAAELAFELRRLLLMAAVSSPRPMQRKGATLGHWGSPSNFAFAAWTTTPLLATRYLRPETACMEEIGSRRLICNSLPPPRLKDPSEPQEARGAMGTKLDIRFYRPFLAYIGGDGGIRTLDTALDRITV
jgi:hypothetical protein